MVRSGWSHCSACSTKYTDCRCRVFRLKIALANDFGEAGHGDFGPELRGDCEAAATALVGESIVRGDFLHAQRDCCVVVDVSESGIVFAKEFSTRNDVGAYDGEVR